MFTMSKWESIKYWECWKHSKDRKKYHKDDNDDVNGYNELLRKLVQNEDKANEK